MFVIYGFFVGIAELIPGVSGSTIAAILGVYERIIKIIGGVDSRFIKDALSLTVQFPFSKGGRKRFFLFLKERDVLFLFQILLGDAIAILTLSSLFTYLLTEQRELIYGFFTGLIGASLYFFIRGVKKMGMKEYILLLVCIASLVMMAKMHDALSRFEENSAFYQSVLEGGANMVSYQKKELIVIFFSGILASGALVLPGVSGSFVLLLLGKYLPVIAALNFVRSSLMRGELPFFEAFYLVSFLSGVLIGVLLMSKFINVLLTKYRSFFDAFIIGLLIGSLYVIWPFKKFIFVDGYVKEHQNILFKKDLKLYLSENQSFLEILSNHQTFLSIFSIIIGVLFIFFMHYLGRRNFEAVKEEVK